MMKNRNTIFPTILLVLACFAISPLAQAVVPAPDGGYPGGNTAEGQNALFSLTTGGFNTAVGFLSLRSDTIGSFNTATGAGTLLANTADQNTATGAGALLSNTTGQFNTANGAFALLSNTTGGHNTANGTAALGNNTTGGFDTANGTFALGNNTTGSANTALGNVAGGAVTTANNVICIGAYGANVDNTTWISNIYGTGTVSGTTLPVIVSDNGQLGTATSSGRFKTAIKPMDQTSEAVLALKPVTFHYKSDVKGTPQFGLVAEEVAKVNPDLVVRDKNGEIYTVRYDAVNVMLLNEFLKEHRKVEEQECRIQKQQATITEVESNAARHEATIALQQQQIERLTLSLKAQASQLQKVTVQLELSKPSPQTVLNDQ